MNFERNGDIKGSLEIGIPSYKIYRMECIRYNYKTVGWFIMTPGEIEDSLKMLEEGELKKSNYLIAFTKKHNEFKNQNEMLLELMPTCFIEYLGKKYFIENTDNAV
jgi:hypothetical protein